MSRNRRKWVGNLKTLPLDPDLVLSRLVQWTRDPQQRFSSLDGPEPDNLTCASAWQGQVPEGAIAREAFIYRDKHTDLWIQAVPWRIVNQNEMPKWCDMQRALGAQAVWYNYNSKPHRRRKTYAERELIKIHSNDITYVDLLHESGKLKFGDIDFTKLIPHAQPRSVDIDILKLLAQQNPTGKRRYAKLAPGERQRLAYKPVRTPLGLFGSVNAAAAAHGFTASKMSVLINRDDGTNYQFIDKNDYAKLILNVNTSEHREDSELEE